MIINLLYIFISSSFYFFFFFNPRGSTQISLGRIVWWSIVSYSDYLSCICYGKTEHFPLLQVLQNLAICKKLCWKKVLKKEDHKIKTPQISHQGISLDSLKNFCLQLAKCKVLMWPPGGTEKMNHMPFLLIHLNWPLAVISMLSWTKLYSLTGRL